jgi:hypothetical protein
MNTTASVWLIKLLLAHLLTDFVLQPNSWVKDRKEKHFGHGGTLDRVGQ